MDYTIYIIEFFAVLIGLLLGMFLAFSVAKVFFIQKPESFEKADYRKKRSIHKKQKAIIDKETEVLKEKKQEINKSKEISKNNNTLQDRLPSKDNSWTEFNCSADNESEELAIVENQSNEDDAYHVLKRRKFKK